MKRKTITLWLSILLIFTLLAACANKKEIAEQHFQAGREFSRNDQPDSALAQYKLALQANPRHIEANTYYQNLLRYELDKEDEVFDEYQTKAEEHPRDPVYRYLYARLEDDPDKMKEEAEGIIRLDSQYYYGHYLHGYANYRIGYDDDALDAFNKAVEIDPTNPDAYFYQAIIHNNNSEYDEAIETYKKIIELDTTRIYYYTSIWRIEYNRAEDKEVAKKGILTDIDAMLEKYPDDLIMLSSLRYLYRTMGEADRAKDAEEKLLVKDEKGVYAQGTDYNKIYQKPNNKERIQAANEFLKKYPKARMRKYVYSTWFRYAQNEPSFDAKDMDNIVNRWQAEFPRDVYAYYTPASGYYLDKGENYPKALELANRGLEISSRRMRRYLLDTKGWAHYKLGEYVEALTALAKADSLYEDPSSIGSYHLGAAYLKLNDLDRAIESLVQSLAIKEDKEVRDQFYVAYKEKHGSRKGADDFLVKEILAVSAVKEPFEAPDFTLASLTGEQVSLSSHIGKVILANFWKPG